MVVAVLCSAKFTKTTISGCFFAKGMTAYQRQLLVPSVQVQSVCKGIMHMLGTLAAEYEDLLKRIAIKQEPLAIGQELQVGQLPGAGP